MLTNLADESNVTVRMQSLSCAMKLFFKRPPEMQAMLGAALLAGSRDLNQEVHDLARFYYRLLEKDARAAERVVNSRDKSAVHTFKESVMEEKTFDKVFTEFNTLSVLYGRPAETFVDANATTRRRREEEDDDLDMNKQDVDAGAASLLDHSDMIDLGSDNASASGGSTVDLLAMLDVNVAEPAPPGPFALDPSPTLDAPSFQAKWTTASLIASGIQAKMRSSAVASTADVTARLAPLGVATMASGGPPEAMKFFFYAVDGGNRDTFLVEALLDATAGSGTFTAKCDGRGENFVAFQRLFAESLAKA